MRRLNLLLLLMVVCAGTSKAQQAEGNVEIHADPRLDIFVGRKSALLALQREQEEADNAIDRTPLKPVVIYSGEGFRVQVYNGPSRDKAMAVKAEIMRRYPTIHTYLTYSSPSFRVKVGDYRYRHEAEKILNEVNNTYRTSMIVPDVVTITNF